MTERYAHLDGLRGVAAANVAISHALAASDFALYTGKPEQAHGSWEVGVSGWPLLLPGAGANTSVCVFLVLSGIVLAHAFMHTRLGAAALAAKRLVRLAVPVLAGALLGFAVLAGGMAWNQEAASLTRSPWLHEQLNHAAWLPGALFEGLMGALAGQWSYAGSYDSVLWTMPIEFLGSLLLIVLFSAGRGLVRRGRPGSAAALGVLGAVCWPHYIALMLFGAALCLAGPRRWAGGRAAAVPAAVLGVAGLVLGTVPYSVARGAWAEALVSAGAVMAPWWSGTRLGAGVETMDAVAVWHGIGALLLIVAVELSPWTRRQLARPFCIWLGRISFPLYLLHVPVLLSVGCGGLLLATRWGAPYPVAVALAVTAYLMVAVGLAHLAVRGLERPSVALAARAGAAVQRAIDGMRPQLRAAAPPLRAPRE